MHAAIQLLGNPAIGDQQMEQSMLALAGQPGLAQRLLDVIPEGFGLILAAHIAGGDKLQLPTTFSVKDALDNWVEIPLRDEPIFAFAVQAAQHIFHHGPRSVFQTVTDRSATVATINNALNAGGSLVDAKLGLSLLNIPAETYLTHRPAAPTRQ
ncbi:hypothetical protein [Pseudomonas sp.]|uniref:hypothetical protein n=1 Tax=Pseudomonas sp. TaxID=306 RepID=UPI003398ADF0